MQAPAACNAFLLPATGGGYGMSHVGRELLHSFVPLLLEAGGKYAGSGVSTAGTLHPCGKTNNR